MAKGPKPMRNWAATNPLMRKGGPHRDAKLKQRPRQDTRQALDAFEDWLDEETTTSSQHHNEGPQGPSFFRAPFLARATAI
ncbi:hypothetical protein [Marinobacter sp. JSM 1782161]|uniref:hypothetical protein n=1 Tax=Marinobacter sp. JSM 1782161 TaxID=2685906 RepID=UPI001403AD05|nr:hypothetical protein [Marinobacter sp. JSM 1782161]